MAVWHLGQAETELAEHRLDLAAQLQGVLQGAWAMERQALACRAGQCL